MDEERLEEVTDRWVEAGLIDREAAKAIRTFESDRTDESSRGLTTILAGMGAALIGAGILVFLGANWDGLPRWARSAILLGVPAALGAGSIVLDRRGLGRPALGTWILAAIAVGPSLVLLTQMHVPDVDPSLPLLLWGAIAIPMGHAFRTRLATGVGLVAFIGAAVLLGDGGAAMLAGGVGVLYLAAAIPAAKGTPSMGETYQLVGLATLIGVFLWGTVVASRFVDGHVSLEPTGLAGLVGAVAAAGLVGVGYYRGELPRDGAMLTVVAGTGLVLLTGWLVTLDLWPWLVGFFGVHGIFLAVLIACVSVALGLGSSLLVNLLVFGFFLQIVALLGPLTDVLPGALTLVVVGVILLSVAIGLERLRRRLLERVVPG